MTTENVEERFKKSEEKIKSLEHENERLRAVNEIRNLVSRLQYLHTANRNSDIASLFSQKDPDVRLYFGELGYWRGPDGPRKAGKVMGGMGGSHLAMHLMVNPVIEVAGDGKTARAVFVACGLVARKDDETGKPTAMWEWNRYGEDFIKEDGQWKLWHHHVYPLFQIGWDENWAEHFEKKQGEMPAMQMPDDLKPDFPATPGDVFYSPDTVLPFIPVPPEPYETWSEEMGY